MIRFFLTLAALIPCIVTTAQTSGLILPSELKREQIIRHKAFTLSYNSSYVQPSWVTYMVTKAQVNENDKVKGKYLPDPEILTRAATPKDYKDGGYIMAQYVNYLDVKQQADAIPETFYMSNITAMKLAYYNHIWLKTEQLIRLWTIDTDGLQVVCGPILNDAPFTTLGDNNVSIPERFYKIVYDPKNQKAIGFIFKNGMSSGSLSSFVRTIDEIESETGIDMFPALDDALESTLEATVDLSKWNFELIE